MLRLYTWLIVLLCIQSQISFAKGPDRQNVQDNYYVLQDEIVIDQDITTNLYAIGSIVTINGIIRGNLYVLGGTVICNGGVDGNLYSMSASTILNGAVKGNLYVFSANMETQTTTSVEGSTNIFAGRATIKGHFNNKIRIYAPFCKFGAIATDHVRIHTTNLEIDKGAKFQQLDYWSKNESISLAPAQNIVFHPSIYSSSQFDWLGTIKLSSFILAIMMNFFYSFIIGLMIIRYYPEMLDKTMVYMRSYPFKTPLYGLLVMIGLPLLCILMLITIVGLPFALTLIAFNIMGFYSAKILTLLWASKKLPYFQRHTKTKFLVCLIAYFFVKYIPYIGVFITTIATIFGLGCFMLYYTRK